MLEAFSWSQKQAPSTHRRLSTQELDGGLFLHYLLLTSRSWPVHACLSAIRKLVYFLVGLKTCSVIYRLFFFLNRGTFYSSEFFDGIAPYTKHTKAELLEGSSRPQPLPSNAGSEPLRSVSRAPGPLFEILRPI